MASCFGEDDVSSPRFRRIGVLWSLSSRTVVSLRLRAVLSFAYYWANSRQKFEQDGSLIKFPEKRPCTRATRS